MSIIARTTRRAAAIAAATLIAAAAFAVAQGALPDVERIGDEGGRFDVPVPPRWLGEVNGPMVRLTPPDGSGAVSVIVVDDADRAAALDESVAEILEHVWETVGADEMPPLARTSEGSSRSGVERTIMAELDAGSDWVAFATLERLDEKLYVIVVDVALETWQRRSAEVARIGSGLRIAALQRDEAEPAAMRPVAEIVPDLEAFVARWLEAIGVPGVGIAVVHEGEVVYRGAFGVRSTESGEPFSVDDRVMIGSVGKALTSALIGVLAEDGLLGWDTPVVDALPGFALQDAAATDRATMRHLACACIGVPSRDVETLLRADSLDAQGVIASLATMTFSTGFGETFQYSNELLAAAGFAAAATAGADLADLGGGYADVLRERLLEPLGMSRTTLDAAAVLAAGDHAAPHTYDVVTDAVVPIDPALERMLDPIAPAGAHWSTLDDLARFASALLPIDGAGPALPAASVVEAWTPHVAITDTLSYGLGWFVERRGGHLVVHHGGNTLGFTTEVALVPASSLAVIVVANAVSSNNLTVGIRDRLLELVFQREPRVERDLELSLQRGTEVLDGVRSDLGDTVELADVREHLGRFVHERAGEVSLVLEGSELLLRAGTFATRLVPFANDAGADPSFLMRDPPLILTTVRLTSHAGVPTLEFGSGIAAYRFTRVGEP